MNQALLATHGIWAAAVVGAFFIGESMKPKGVAQNGSAIVASTAQEQAWPLAFLNSDAASYISGENLYTDGGACSGVLNGSIDGALMVPDDYNN